MRRSTWAALILLLVGGDPALAESVYHESFDSDQGTFTITNSEPSLPGSPPDGWAFDTACPPATSAPQGAGVLRWGLFSDCTEYGEHGTVGRAATPVVTTCCNCTLSFNYHLDFERTELFETAQVELSVDGGDGQTYLDSENGTLVNAATWLAVGVPLPDGEVQITFVGTAGDGLFNTGTGWSIDDVDIDCPNEGVPATSGWGVVVLLVGISLALVSGLLRRRTA